MAKSVKVKPKRVRPATGRDPLMGFRAAPEIRGKIVHWAENQPDMPALSEAIRRLVEKALKSEAPPKPIAKPGRRTRAKELARDAIEKMADPAASPEERTQRQRRLTKGPEEFREVRVDLPKRKR